jgi:hypothetical protein
MVQVDIFWSYAIGAGFAAAAGRQIRELTGSRASSIPDSEKPSIFQNKYFTYNLIFLACAFAPSGVYLLWNFPHWETMQVARTHTDLPAWLVVLFAITNITQGIIGFWITGRLFQKGHYYAGHLQWFLGYFCMFFILLHGWDGLGWQRFLYDPTVTGALWTPGQHMGIDFLWSNVALTLYTMGIVIVPGILLPMAKWIRAGAEADVSLPKEMLPAGLVKLMIFSLMGVFVISLGSSAITGLLVNYIGKLAGSLTLGFIVGIPLAIVLVYFTILRKPMPGYAVYRRLFIAEPQQRENN